MDIKLQTQIFYSALYKFGIPVNFLHIGSYNGLIAKLCYGYQRNEIRFLSTNSTALCDSKTPSVESDSTFDEWWHDLRVISLDMNFYPYNVKFDMILCTRLFNIMPSHEFIRKIIRLMSPKGKLILCVSHSPISIVDLIRRCLHLGLLLSDNNTLPFVQLDGKEFKPLVFTKPTHKKA